MSEDDVEEIRREYELDIGCLEKELATMRADNDRLREALAVFIYEELNEDADFGEWFEAACEHAKEALK